MRTTFWLKSEEKAAVVEAMKRRRQRTGEDVRFAVVIREGLEKACAEEGVAWPKAAT